MKIIQVFHKKLNSN